MTTDIIMVTINSLNLPLLEDDVIADAEYSPGEITAWRQVCLEIHGSTGRREDMENEIHSTNVKMMRIHPHPSRVQTKPKIYN